MVMNCPDSRLGLVTSVNSGKKPSKMEASDLLFLNRCCDLARLGGAAVSPNPRVGAVLVYQGRIIGEGFHAQAGGPHAEVQCVHSVHLEDQPLIPHSTLYVSLEPCCFHGRTPACTDLILENGIRKVVIGQIDQTAAVSGKGIQILTSAGVSVRTYTQHQGCQKVALERQIFATQKRPYVQLKYAQTADGFLAPADQRPYWISSAESRILTHRWRTRTGAILVGANTVLKDDPQLNSRLYPGPDPLRIVVDPKGLCSGEERIFQSDSSKAPTLWLRPKMKAKTKEQVEIYALSSNPGQAIWGKELINIIFQLCHEKALHHLTVEGGSSMLELFLNGGYWDEITRFINPKKVFAKGLLAPQLDLTPAEVQNIGGDTLEVFYR